MSSYSGRSLSRKIQDMGPELYLHTDGLSRAQNMLFVYLFMILYFSVYLSIYGLFNDAVISSEGTAKQNTDQD
jgi:hypothetical protein